MSFYKLKRTWHNNYAYIPNFKKVFPELSKISHEDLCDRFIELNMDFYYQEQTPTPLWARPSLPFFVIAFILIYLTLPIHFMLTGRWMYSPGNKIIMFMINWSKVIFG